MTAIQIEQERVYTLDEIATLLRTTVTVMRAAVRAKRLTAYKVGKEYRVVGSDLDAYLTRQSTQ